jgi:D-alanyl-D-alanine carboxypeptidase
MFARFSLRARFRCIKDRENRDVEAKKAGFLENLAIWLKRTLVVALVWCAFYVPLSAAPYAALVMDARTGQVLHSRNADARLHPASLTKMMTLYIAFEAIRTGEISLDTKVRISKHAASEPPSKLGLRSGQKIALRYLIRAASVKSANDAATAIGEAISGSEAAFARRMTRTAKALGMSRTTFRNAHGLTEEGHLSTARDMSVLGRHILYDYPQYYNLFSRRSTDAGIKSVKNTNRKFLAAYKGADGIKTGYTNAAGFNLVASAERGGTRIIATLFGGRSTATRNARVVELLDMGFGRAPGQVAFNPPKLPSNDVVTKTVRVVRAVKVSMRPRHRPVQNEEVLLAMASQIESAVAEVASAAVAKRPKSVPKAEEPVTKRVVERLDGLEVVSRMSTSGGRLWSINLGGHPTRTHAEKLLLRTALQELDTLDGALRKVVHRRGEFEANFVGLSKNNAMKACARLRARQTVECSPVGPAG